MLQQQSNILPEDLEIFFPGLRKTYHGLNSAGIITDSLTPAQSANVRTPLSCWSVINGITDFASHNYGYEKNQNSDFYLQTQAGDMLSKQFDTVNIIANQPF